MRTKRTIAQLPRPGIKERSDAGPATARPAGLALGRRERIDWIDEVLGDDKMRRTDVDAPPHGPPLARLALRKSHVRKGLRAVIER